VRQNAAVPLAAGLGLIGSSALATQRWWLLPVLLVPLAVLGWALRSGVDADRDGLTVRSLLGSRRIRWDEVDGFTTSGRGVRALLAGGRSIVLPAVTGADVPRLLDAGGQQLDGRDLDGRQADGREADEREADGRGAGPAEDPAQ